jgi:hypothetical protein
MVLLVVKNIGTDGPAREPGKAQGYKYMVSMYNYRLYFIESTCTRSGPFARIYKNNSHLIKPIYIYRSIYATHY